MIQTLSVVSVLVLVYAAAIAALVLFLRALHVDMRHAFLAAFLIFGLFSGILVTILWPQDISVLANFPAAWLGDWLYVQTIAWIGDPFSDHAHFTIPWLFRVPQVYALASCGLYALIGLALEQCLRFARHG